MDNIGDLQIGHISPLNGIAAPGIVSVSVVGSFTIDEAIDSAGGDVDRSATIDITVNAPITSGGGKVSLRANRNIIFTALGSIDTEIGGATVTLTADADHLGGGGITMANGSYVDATDGFIDMDATDNIVLSHLRTTTQVDIDSTAGSILDAGDLGDTDLEIFAPGPNCRRPATSALMPTNRSRCPKPRSLQHEWRHLHRRSEWPHHWPDRTVWRPCSTRC